MQSSHQCCVLFAVALCGCSGHVGDSHGTNGRDAGGPAQHDATHTTDAATGLSTTGRAAGGDASASTTSADAGLATTSKHAGTGAPSTSDGGRPPPTGAMRLYGVTIDSIDALDEIVQSLQMLARRPTTRIVFDQDVSASDYRRSVARIHTVSGVMGEILDSETLQSSAVNEYSARVTEYLNTLGDNVDIWEIGNEVNGDWLGNSDDVHNKITSAYQLVHARGKPTALTLYYNQGCAESPDHEMFRWANAYVDDELKAGLDYVLISYYDDNCYGLRPDWPSVFKRLAMMFPNSKLGFGECGTTDAAKKAEFIQRYYQLQIALPQYIGGYFWWYYYQDMLPYTSQLWSVLNETLANGP